MPSAGARRQALGTENDIAILRGFDAMAVTRPVLRYHGGKWAIGEWIIAQMPPHEIYVEAFAGAGSVLMRKERCGPEVINDLDGELVNVFRVLQDPAKAEQVRRRIALTPFARAEFDRTYEQPLMRLIGRAKRLPAHSWGLALIRSPDPAGTGFRSKLRTGGFPAEAWARWPASVPDFVERLAGVLIENRDACEVMLRSDTPSTLFYVDPPYVASTRSSIEGRSAKTHGYRFEMTDDDHCRLAEVLLELKGMVMLSGYPSALYEDLYGDWERMECETLADTSKPRTECLWFNAAAWERSRRQQSLGFALQPSGASTG